MKVAPKSSLRPFLHRALQLCNIKNGFIGVYFEKIAFLLSIMHQSAF